MTESNATTIARIYDRLSNKIIFDPPEDDRRLARLQLGLWKLTLAYSAALVEDHLEMDFLLLEASDMIREARAA